MEQRENNKRQRDDWIKGFKNPPAAASPFPTPKNKLSASVTTHTSPTKCYTCKCGYTVAPYIYGLFFFCTSCTSGILKMVLIWLYTVALTYLGSKVSYFFFSLVFKVCPFFYAEAEEALYCHLVVIFQKPDHSVTLGLKKGCKNCRHCKIIKHFRFITFIDFNVSQINKSTVNFKIKYNLKVSIEKKKN